MASKPTPAGAHIPWLHLNSGDPTESPCAVVADTHDLGPDTVVSASLVPTIASKFGVPVHDRTLRAQPVDPELPQRCPFAHVGRQRRTEGLWVGAVWSPASDFDRGTHYGGVGGVGGSPRHPAPIVVATAAVQRSEHQRVVPDVVNSRGKFNLQRGEREREKGTVHIKQ